MTQTQLPVSTYPLRNAVLFCLSAGVLTLSPACKDGAPSNVPVVEVITTSVDDGDAPTIDEVSDAGIEDAVARQLISDGLTPNFAIEVEVEDGIVALDGEVDNMLAKQRATRVAQAVRGVRSVSNRIDVVTVEVPDAELRANVDMALLFDPATESYEIELDAKHGVVTMTGAVSSWAERHLAERVVASVRGVEHIDNHLAIDYAEPRTDTDIRLDVEKLLINDVLIDERQIDVSVDDGVVTLTGTVGSAIERTMARARAWTNGVDQVDADALVVNWLVDDPELRDRRFRPRSEAEIYDAIVTAALHDPRVSSFKIEPEVNGSFVTLDGTVNNLAAKQAAEQLARNTTGVAAVANDIEVVTSSALSDGEIASTVISRLALDTSASLREIDVDVDKRVVTLTGSVDSYREKAEATLAASRAKGVMFVDNLLSVASPTAAVPPSPMLDPYGPFEPYVMDMAVAIPSAETSSDEEIEMAIETELYWSPFVDEQRVYVSVEDGRAVLTGTVDSRHQRLDATRNAYEGGATAVDNMLHIDS